ncbi:Maltodextrin glucosidase [hydrothermal vent metagenome]|uniref:Maltodextrin glucosidase n=1 Tax=hydrothermal vent metagenome TaxID=652676 RepID=A0A3B0U7F1_9ZZZZ
MSEWWRGGVIYQIYPRSFQDSNADGVGDLPGIIERVGHVANLGVDAIWLSPFFTSPMNDMGYDVANYKDVDPLFGSLEDFDTLAGHAHDLGLKVIIDQVLSHTSDHHSWFRESRVSRTNARADWYVWAEARADGTPPNNWLSVFGGSAWEWHPSRKQYYLHNFLTSQPDLNFHNPEVRAAVLDVLRFWLERGVDGFRFDTVNFYFHDKKLRNNPALARKTQEPEVNPYEMQLQKFSKNRPENLDFLKTVRTLLNEFDAASVGEVGESQNAIEIMAAYSNGNQRLHMAYSFDMLGEEFSARHFRSKIEQFNKKAPDGWPCWSFSNHDVTRHVSRWAHHANDPKQLARQTAALLLSMGGSVSIYQGEELGLPEADILFEELTDPPGIRFWPEYKGRDGCRTPIPWDKGKAPNGFTTGDPWLPIKPAHSALNVASQIEDPNSTLAFYKEFLAFRRLSAALMGGNIKFYDTSEPVLAFERRQHTNGNEQDNEGDNDKTLICLFNLSKQKLVIELDGLSGARLAPVSRAAHLSAQQLQLDANGFALIFPGKTNSREISLHYKKPARSNKKSKKPAL